jgi:FkbM family methyltransferase
MEAQLKDLIKSKYQTGTFLEIGCWDGVNISNTYELEQEGWSGVCVDPFPRNFEKRSCQLIQTAIVGEKCGTKKFLKVSIDRAHGGDVSYFSGWAETVWNNLNISKLIIDSCDFEIVDVERTTFTELMQMTGRAHFDFLSIDTEGSELEIIKGIDFDKYSFGFISVEHNYNFDKKQAIRSIMFDNGYDLVLELPIDDLFANDNI